MELLQYQLRDANERAAIERLKYTRGDQRNHPELQHLVLAYLALIGEKYSDSAKPKSERIVQILRRRATKIRNFAHWLESSSPNGLTPLGSPLTAELLRFAESLSLEADLRAVQARKQFRHSTHMRSNLILRLLRFVREQTGKPHFPELATLLSAACNDYGMNAKRLQALWRRRVRRPGWFRASVRQVAPNH